MEIWILGVARFSKPFLLLEFETPGWAFSKLMFLQEIANWDPGIFPKSQISRISCCIHSEWAHIKLNGFQSWFAGLRGTPFDFFMGWKRSQIMLGIISTHVFDIFWMDRTCDIGNLKFWKMSGSHVSNSRNKWGLENRATVKIQISTFSHSHYVLTYTGRWISKS